MKKYILIMAALLFVVNVNYAQNQEGEEEGFTMKFVFKYKDKDAVDITITDTGSDARLLFIGTTCDRGGNQHSPISQGYTYQQLRDYLSDIDVETYKPQNNDHDTDANLQIKFVYFSHGNSRRSNSFHWNYNPDNIGDENMILEYLFEVVEMSISRSCDRDFFEKVKTYLEKE